VSIIHEVREFFIGAPLPTARLEHERVSNVKALAALSPDALASIAYSNQEIYLGLVIAGAAGIAYTPLIAGAIVGLLIILAISYSQTISAYPGGGGSYTVAKENLGDNFGLASAAALMTDYTLNVAVSITAGVAAIASAFPVLWPYRVPLALLLLIIITLANLRGLREAGAVMIAPIFLFIGTYLVMIAVGVFRAITEGPGTPPVPLPAAQEQISTLIILHTFATGCTALTGIEAISNGVTIFRPPESKNANRTMAVMTLLMAVLFMGTIGLTQYFSVATSGEETILSALARRVFSGSTIPYLIVQTSTLLVLTVAANTSFMGFPRVASILARDSYMPRQLNLLGDRLVFSNGIVILSVVAGILVVIFQGDTHLLIPLFAIGAFMAFALSQAGMVAHWWRERGQGWIIKMVANGFGTLATVVALLIIGVSKFLEGAWIVVLIIPLQMLIFRAIKQHYKEVRQQLTLYEGLPPDLKPLPEPRVVMPIGGVHRGIINALRYAHSIARNVTAVYIEIDPDGRKQIQERWEEWGLDEDYKLVIVESPYRSLIGPFLEFLDKADREANDGQLATVLLPEFIPEEWWAIFLHNQNAWLLKLALLYGRRRFNKIRAIIDIPMYLRDL
jgi:amino acid transporter